MSETTTTSERKTVHPLTMDDVHCLRGHAQILRVTRGEVDMPTYFEDLANRIAAQLPPA